MTHVAGGYARDLVVQRNPTMVGRIAETLAVRSKSSQFRLLLRKVNFEMRPHEKLEVWKRAIEFVVTVYKMTESFPRDERFGLISQIRRAAVSVPANIAEGAARHSSKEFRYFWLTRRVLSAS